MALHPHFYSTLFGVYYFVASLLGALGLLIILSSILTNRFNLDKIIEKDFVKKLINDELFLLILQKSLVSDIYFEKMLNLQIEC